MNICGTARETKHQRREDEKSRIWFLYWWSCRLFKGATERLELWVHYLFLLGFRLAGEHGKISPKGRFIEGMHSGMS